MTSILLLAALVAPVSAAAEKNPCRYAYQSTDKFGGDSKITIGIQDFTGLNVVGLKMYRRSGSVQLEVMVRQVGALSGAIPVGAEIPLSVGDNEALTLQTVVETARQPYVNGSVVSTNETYVLGLSPDDLQALSTKTFNAMRVPTPQGPYDWTPRKGAQTRMRDAATCMIQQTGG